MRSLLVLTAVIVSVAVFLTHVRGDVPDVADVPLSLPQSERPQAAPEPEPVPHSVDVGSLDEEFDAFFAAIAEVQLVLRPSSAQEATSPPDDELPDFARCSLDLER